MAKIMAGHAAGDVKQVEKGDNMYITVGICYGPAVIPSDLTS